jgi:hypothetical protein
LLAACFKRYASGMAPTEFNYIVLLVPLLVIFAVPAVEHYLINVQAPKAGPGRAEATARGVQWFAIGIAVLLALMVSLRAALEVLGGGDPENLDGPTPLIMALSITACGWYLVWRLLQARSAAAQLASPAPAKALLLPRIIWAWLGIVTMAMSLGDIFGGMRAYFSGEASSPEAERFLSAYEKLHADPAFSGAVLLAFFLSAALSIGMALRIFMVDWRARKVSIATFNPIQALLLVALWVLNHLVAALVSPSTGPAENRQTDIAWEHLLQPVTAIGLVTFGLCLFLLLTAEAAAILHSRAHTAPES